MRSWHRLMYKDLCGNFIRGFSHNFDREFISAREIQALGRKVNWSTININDFLGDNILTLGSSLYSFCP